MAELAKPEPPPVAVAYHGFVSTPPKDLDDEFTVSVPSFDDQYVFQVQRWERRGETLPKEGDEVLVILDDQEEPWLAAWWPAEGDVIGEGEPGPEGPPGEDGKDGSVWYTGEGAPAGGLGIDGDFYLRSSNGDVYKKAGTWSVVANIKGPKGDTGATGEKGATGSTGPEGKEGPEGPEGPKGEPGDAGGAFTQKIGNGSATSFTITHNLGTRAVVVVVRQAASPYKQVWAGFDAEAVSTTEAKVAFDEAPATDEYVVLVMSGAGEAGPEGPEGPQGPEGKTGATGPEGPQGKEGPAGAATMADYKESVRVCTTSNVGISTALNPGDTIDGITLAENDRVLVANQTVNQINGIYVVKASPSRATDADSAGELSGGTMVYVEEGEIYGDRVMRITNNGSITPGVHEQVWAPLMPKDFGLVEALPTKVLKGDLCTFHTAAMGTVYWQLVYDGEKWPKIGGPPLLASSDTERTLTNKTTFESLPTDPLKITIPVAGDYDIRHAAGIKFGALTGTGAVSVAVGATVASDNWAAFFISNANSQAVDVSKGSRFTGVAASAEVIEKARTGGNYPVGFLRRRLWVDPVRLG